MIESQTPTVVVKRSVRGMGLGLFAARPILKGEHILDYTGDIITAEEADTRDTRYLFEIDDRYVIDGTTRSNIARYMNHFCRPNVEAEVIAGEVKFFALRNIDAGEELGFDYGTDYVAQFIAPKGCQCPTHRDPAR